MAESSDSTRMAESSDSIDLARTTQVGQYPQTMADGDAINLGLGQPSPSLLPLGAIRDAAARRLGAAADPLVMQYGHRHGAHEFRAALAQFLSDGYHVPVTAETLLVTGGNSTALALVSQVFSYPGHAVACGDPTYFLARGIFETQRLDVVSVPVDDGGLDVDALDRVLRAGQKLSFVYCIPSFHNPRAVTLTPERCERLIELAEAYDFLVVADEPYVLLHFADAPPPCLMSFDRGRGRVLSLGSFSKILGPGLRLGWAHAEPGVLERLADHGAVLSGGGLNPVMASIVQGTLDSGFLPEHVASLRATFRERCAALCQALREHLPGCAFHEPLGGYFVWLDLAGALDGAIDTTALSLRAHEHGVRFVAGARCAIQRDLSQYARLSFSFYRPDELQLGVQRLARLVAAIRSAGTGTTS